MKIVILGGSGHIGSFLVPALREAGHEVVVLSRNGSPSNGSRVVPWDGRSLGAWVTEIDGADAIINLAGRSVNCRYGKTNLTDMLASRIDSTRAIGQAIVQVARPPSVWLQMSTATIYAHRFDAPNDEATGLIGGAEPDAPTYWRMSIEIARAWERAQLEAHTPGTRKVALRTAIVMNPGRGGVFNTLLALTRLRLGGAIAGGRQFVSWIHGQDFIRAVGFLLERTDLTGPVNLSSPHPLPQRDFMRALRLAWGARLGLPASKWMIEIAAFIHRTDTELLLKSRRVVPGRLVGSGFTFEFPQWDEGAKDLVARWRKEAA